MNITLAFQELDDLIVKHTLPPAQAGLRNKLHLLRDQTEAYIEAKEKIASALSQLQAAHSVLQDEHAKCKTQGSRFQPPETGFGTGIQRSPY